ncbi:hypothetical protein JXL19_09290 [bacterium]|nr:hypothetical protein [bacterium]
MEINVNATMKNLGTFTHAYGLEPDNEKKIEAIVKKGIRVARVGILLRDPVTKEELISFDVPVHMDCTKQMFWIAIDGKPVEAKPICIPETNSDSWLKNIWKKLNRKMDDQDYYLIEEGDFKLRAYRSFCKKGVIERYLPAEGYGFISRSRKGIFFLKEWCNFCPVREGMEVSFIPVITRKGLQARAVEEIKSIPLESLEMLT